MGRRAARARRNQASSGPRHSSSNHSSPLSCALSQRLSSPPTRSDVKKQVTNQAKRNTTQTNTNQPLMYQPLACQPLACQPLPYQPPTHHLLHIPPLTYQPLPCHQTTNLFHPNLFPTNLFPTSSSQPLTYPPALGSTPTRAEQGRALARSSRRRTIFQRRSGMRIWRAWSWASRRGGRRPPATSRRRGGGGGGGCWGGACR